MFNKIILTGFSGFIGSNVARRLVAQGVELHVLVRDGSTLPKLTDRQIHIHRLTRNASNISDIFEVVQPDAVLHLASLFLAGHKAEDIDGLIESNVTFGTKLLEAMVKVGTQFIINTGTSWQHYKNEDKPVNLYAATKQAFEAILSYYVDAHDIKATTLLLFDTYGPGDPRTKLVSLLWRAAETGQVLDMSPGEQLIDIVEISDVVEAFVVAMLQIREQKEKQARYAVSSSNPITLREFVGEFIRSTGTDIKVNWGAREYRVREVMVPWNTFSPLPNWKAVVPLSIGLQRSGAKP